MPNAYVGIDVNLSGYGLAILTVREIVLRFIPFVQKEKINEAVSEWVMSTRLVDDIVKHRCQDDKIIIAIEDPTGMGAINLGKIDERGRIDAKRIRQQSGAWMVAATLNKLVGMLSSELFQMGELIYPSSVIWKKAICKDGKAKKDEVAAVVSLELLGVSDKDYFEGNHHISDALALAYYAKHMDKEENNGT